MIARLDIGNAKKDYPDEDVLESSILSEATYAKGKSELKIECPFCKKKIWVVKWSFAGRGKRCSCGAFLHDNIARKKKA